jgi:UDP-glucose:(heptosyl)LPS alpha-1,3-glucosyltransferase
MIKLLGRVFSPKQWVSGWIEDTPYRRKNFRKIIAISDMVKHDMVHWYQIPEERIHVIYNGVDIERFHPRNRQFREEVRRRHRIGDELVILFVSNNFRMKGLGCLMKALADLKREGPPPFKLLVLGRDRQGPHLRLAKKNGIFEETVFAGSTNESEKYYGASDLLVHPSFYDACSLTVLEALASGLPVITTSSNGASGVISQGVEGWVIQEMKTGDEIKMAIRYFLDDEIRKQASYRGRSKAEVYSETLNFDRMLRIFREVLTSMGRENHQFFQETDELNLI